MGARETRDHLVTRAFAAIVVHFGLAVFQFSDFDLYQKCPLKDRKTF